jgi:hypothetical protein
LNESLFGLLLRQIGQFGLIGVQGVGAWLKLAGFVALVLVVFAVVLAAVTGFAFF